MNRHGIGTAAALGAALLLGACGGAGDAGADGGTDTGGAGEDAGGIVDLPALRPATWAGQTWIAEVSGTGPGAEAAKAMEGTKAQFQTCLPEATGAEGLAKVVSTALGDECTLTQLANGDDPGYYKGTLTCGSGTVTIDGMINETMVGTALVRTMTAPEGGDAVTFAINLTAKPGDSCGG